MKILKKPVVAVLLTLLTVFASTAISINVKLNNKCEEITDGFYYGVRQQGILMSSVYSCLDSLCTYSGELVLIAENYGIDTRQLLAETEELRHEISYTNRDIDEIFDEYAEFSTALRALELALSNTGLSQRHIEYMTAASQEIAQLRSQIDNSGYNESVRDFYKKFDRFPVNIFAEMFDVDYPDYFA